MRALSKARPKPSRDQRERLPMNSKQPATKGQTKQLRALKRMKDVDIDLSDIPATADWSKALVGKFYRPARTSKSC
jgi:hypothetical protein